MLHSNQDSQEQHEKSKMHQHAKADYEKHSALREASNSKLRAEKQLAESVNAVTEASQAVAAAVDAIADVQHQSDMLGRKKMHRCQSLTWVFAVQLVCISDMILASCRS